MIPTLQSTSNVVYTNALGSPGLSPSSPSPCRFPTRAICCRIFTPALPDHPAASVRDFCSGAYSLESDKPVFTLIFSGTAVFALGLSEAAKLL